MLSSQLMTVGHRLTQFLGPEMTLEDILLNLVLKGLSVLLRYIEHLVMVIPVPSNEQLHVTMVS